MYSFNKEISNVLVVYTFLETCVLETAVEVVCCLKVVIGVTFLSQCGRVHAYGVETCPVDASVTSGP